MTKRSQLLANLSSVTKAQFAEKNVRGQFSRVPRDRERVRYREGPRKKYITLLAKDIDDKHFILETAR